MGLQWPVVVKGLNAIKTFKFSRLLIKSSTLFICPCKLLFISNTLRLYCLWHFILFFSWKSLFKASVKKIGTLFIWVCARVLSWMYQSYRRGVIWIKNFFDLYGILSLCKQDPTCQDDFFHITQTWKFYKNECNNGILLRRPVPARWDKTSIEPAPMTEGFI